MKEDYRNYYHLESYLEQTVKARFDEKGELGAFDFFCIVIWKANRAKSRVAKRIKRLGAPNNLDDSVRALTKEVWLADTNKSKLKILIKKWEFSLPMASAILSVLYPEKFTVYDVRVCAALQEFDSLKNKTSMESIWTGYESFIAAVRRTAPSHLSLRDQDRWLWGKSFHEQLAGDVHTEFGTGT